MFATKSDALNWIKSFAGERALSTKKSGKYYRIYSENGFILSDRDIDEIEDAA